MFFSLALVLSSLSITYNSNNIPINPVSIPSTGIYATAVIDENTNTLCVELFRYDKNSTNGYLRMYAEKTEGDRTYKPVISQTDFAYTQEDLTDVVNFGFGYYGGNNNLSVAYTISVNSDTYHYGPYSQIYQDNYYNGATYEDNSITINSVKVYFSALEEDTYNAISGIIDEGSSAYDNGYNQGYQNGYDKGSQDSFDNGYNSGYDNGYNLGYQEGMYEGLSDTSMNYIFSSILSIGMLPVNVFLRFFEFEIFGIDVGAFVSGLLTIAIILIVVRSVFGGGNNDK